MSDQVETLKDYIEKQERSIAQLNQQILSLGIKQARAVRYVKAYIEHRSASDLDSAIAILESK